MRIALFGALLMTFAALASGCGDSGASQEELNEARAQGAAKERQQQRLKSLEEQLRALQRGGAADGASAGGSASEGCGGGISTNSVTTCGFAQNVRRDYFEQVGSGSGVVYSFSPATGRDYE